MAPKGKLEAQNPLILRAHRLMEAFAKSDDERDFYLERMEGFIIYLDLDKPQQEQEALEAELEEHQDRYCSIPKMTFYEVKKLMESFVNEKVYDIDTKEKLLDIIQSKEARENFLEFLYDHHSELEKWHLFYQERSRIRIIEWLRQNHFHFVFEEDLDLPRNIIEKVKQNLFEPKVGKDVLAARKVLIAKAKTYYSSEALNPRPKRGRPPKQAIKQEVEPQLTVDIYINVPAIVRPFLFTPDLSGVSAITFSSKFQPPEGRRIYLDSDTSPESVHQKLEALRKLSQKWTSSNGHGAKDNDFNGEDLDDFGDDDDDDDDDDEFEAKPAKKVARKPAKGKAKPSVKPSKKDEHDKKDKKVATKKTPAKRIIPIQKNGKGKAKNKK